MTQALITNDNPTWLPGRRLPGLFLQQGMGHPCSDTAIPRTHTRVEEQNREGLKNPVRSTASTNCSPAHCEYCTHLYAQHFKTTRNTTTLQNALTVRIPYGLTPSMMPSIFFQNKLNKAAQRFKRLERKTRRKESYFSSSSFQKVNDN